MLSARIITGVVEDADSLANDLRLRGYAVQVVSPDAIPPEPVDLEITLEECEPETALRRADAVPDAEDLCVFVAPGALTEGSRPIRVVSLIPETPASVVTVPPAPVPAASMEALEESSAIEQPTLLEEPGIEEPEEKIFAEPPREPVIAEARSQALPAPEPEIEAPVLVEVPIVSPEVWRPKPAAAVSLPKPKALSYGELGRHLALWIKRIGANDKLLLKTATVTAMGAVITISVLVLGAAVHRLAPIAPAVQSAGESLMLPAAANASTATNALPQEAKATPPKPRASVVVPHALAPEPQVLDPKPGARHAHNPEEDIVAQDFVIRYRKRPAPPRTQAKKTSGVKQYSDLN